MIAVHITNTVSLFEKSQKRKLFFLALVIVLVIGPQNATAQPEGGDTFSLSCRDANLRSVLAELAIQKRLNIAGLDGVDGALTVTIHLESVPIAAGLQALLEPKGFTFEKRGDIYFIQKPPAPTRPLSDRGVSVPSREPNITVVVEGELISLKAHDASLTQLLSELASRRNINLSVVGEIERRVTVRLSDKPLAVLLDSLAQMTGYTYRCVGDLHFFGEASVLPEQINPLLQRKTIWLKHLPAKSVLNLLPADIPKQHVTISEAHNTVTIVGPAEMIASTARFLAKLDIETDAIRTRQPQGSIAIAVDNRTHLLTVDIKHASLFDVIRQLSIETGVDVVFLGATTDAKPETPATAKSDVSPPAEVDRVTLRLTGATLQTVLSALFIGSRHTYSWTDVQSAEKPMLIIGPGLHEPLAQHARIALSYLDGVQVMELLPQPKDLRITPLPASNVLLLTGSQAQIDHYTAQLAAIDVPQRQAMIKLYLLELTQGTRDELGLTIEGVANRASLAVDDESLLNFDTVSSVPQAFGATLAALVKQNRGKLLANPSLSVVNGRKASIEIGGRHLFETNNPIYPTIGSTVNPGQQGAAGITTFNSYPPSIYRSHFTIETGLMLELTPSIGASGEVAMEIQLAIRDADSLSREASSLSQRLITTTIRVPDNGMVVIGGLLQEKEKEQVSRLPLLWRIPFIGKYLFTARETRLEQTELVVIIQPQVLVPVHRDSRDPTE